MRIDTIRYEQDYPNMTPNDCAVRSLAVSASVPMEDVATMLQALGRKPGDGTSTRVCMLGIKALGGQEVPTMRRIPPKQRRRTRRMISDGGYGYTEQEMRPLTIAQFAARYPTGRYVLLLDTHAVAMIDGVLHDWPWLKRRRSKSGLVETVLDAKPRRRVYFAYRLRRRESTGHMKAIKSGERKL